MMKFEKITNIVVATLVSVILLINIHAQLSYAQQQCPTLCDSNNIVLNVPEACSTETIASENGFDPCCELLETPDEDAGSCYQNGDGACRTISLSGPICPSGGSSSTGSGSEICRDALNDLSLNLGCLTPRTLRLRVDRLLDPESCCERCTCYGDPHCISFERERVTWIECDGRELAAGTNCPITQQECLRQTDHAGNRCTWVNRNAGRVSRRGSPCVSPTLGEEPAIIHFYEAGVDGDPNRYFNSTLVMGERSIITDIIIQDGPYAYSLNVDDCLKSIRRPPEDTDPMNAWKPANDATPNNQDPDFVPRTSFHFEKRELGSNDFGEIVWTIQGLKSSVYIKLHCMANHLSGESQNRINIDRLLEYDEDSLTMQNGFCPTSIIDKGQTSKVEETTFADVNSICGNSIDDRVYRLVCGFAVTSGTISMCANEFCRNNVDFVDNFDRDTCLTYLRDNRRAGTNRGWDYPKNKIIWAFCLAHSEMRASFSSCRDSTNWNSNDPACEKVQECFDMFEDDGPTQAYDFWVRVRPPFPADRGCVSLEEFLSEKDNNDIENAIAVQTFNGTGWENFGLIDNDRPICGDGDLVFDNRLHSEIFNRPVRLRQCAPRRGFELLCKSTPGFRAAFTLSFPDSENQILQSAKVRELRNLFAQGVLECADETNCVFTSEPGNDLITQAQSCTCP